MNTRHINWQNVLVVLCGAILLSLPIAIGYIPIYHWFGLHTPSNLGIRWVYGIFYCLVEILAIFAIIFVVACLYQFKRLYNFIFPPTDDKPPVSDSVRVEERIND